MTADGSYACRRKSLVLLRLRAVVCCGVRVFKGLKIPPPQGVAGSNPASGTITIESIEGCRALQSWLHQTRGTSGSLKPLDSYLQLRLIEPFMFFRMSVSSELASVSF